MARTVYLETSIISYLAARPSRDLVTAARQQALKLPRRTAADAVHIATAAFHSIDFLLTWNSTHYRQR